MQYVILISDVAVGSKWHITITTITTNNQVQLSVFAVVHDHCKKSSIEPDYCLTSFGIIIVIEGKLLSIIHESHYLICLENVREVSPSSSTEGYNDSGRINLAM